MSSVSTLSYNTGWCSNGFSWSTRDDKPFRFAVSSFVHEYNNTVDIVQRCGERLVCRGTFPHSYPPTKIMFAPQTHKGSDVLITTADYLRIWEILEQPGPNIAEGSGANQEESKGRFIDSSVSMSRVFDFGKPNDFCSPVTSCDWNIDNPTIVGCCSIDTTVTIWDIEQGKHTVQLIAHDKDVFDIAFAQGSHTFASCGADGAVRIFDLREMEHCTIVYESPTFSPLLRVAWSMSNPACISTFGVNDSEVIVLDTRYPSVPIATLSGGHTSPINSISWASNSNCISTAGEDSVVNIWDLDNLGPGSNNTGSESGIHRSLTFEALRPVNCVSWSSIETEYVGITCGEQAQVLRI